MGARVGLFEYLGVVVDRSSAQDGAGTRSTFTDAETYDDDACLDLEWQPVRDGTRLTHSHDDDETFDDDDADLTLRQPGPGVGRESTLFTRTEPETYDDDPATGGLSLPGR